MKPPVFACLLLLSLAARPAAAEIPADLVTKLKPLVVNVEKTVSVSLNREETGRSLASGFIVDSKRGIIATNRHVTGTSPSRVKITFENGESTEARLLYTDAWNDFGFYQIEPSKLDFALPEAALGDSFALKEQDDVVMIGNNDAQEYSVKFGKVSNLWMNRGTYRHSASMQTTFDRAGGSSGSPVFDAHGKVVAIHFAGTETTSFELRVEYLKDALAQLRTDGRVRRGDSGLVLDLLLVSDAEKHYHLPAALAKKVLALRPSLKRMTSVDRRVPRTSAEAALLPGDLILTVDGKWIGDDLYQFDKLVDAKTGGEVEIGAVRNGRELTASLKVQDAEALKSKRFVQFAGGTLQDPTPEFRLHTDFQGDAVVLGQADRGSSLEGLGFFENPESNLYDVLLEGVNGTPTPDLESFIKAVRPLNDRDHIYVLMRDRHATYSGLQDRKITLDLKFSPLKVFDWSQKDLDWVAEP